MWRVPAALLTGFALCAAAGAKGPEMQDEGARPSGLRPPGNPDLAVQGELEEARRKGTIAAYDLFIARQRQHPLAAVARRERAALAARRGK